MTTDWDIGNAHLDAIEDEVHARVLLRANPHKYGPGKVHVFEDGRTPCGKTRENTPGKLVHGDLEDVDCKGCWNSIEARRRQAQRDREWKQQRAEREAERQRENDRWWRDYNAYLQTPQWQERRELVLRRAGHVCEGCGERRAVQVHHTTYERVTDEMLWELRAVCRKCHRKLHPGMAA